MDTERDFQPFSSSQSNGRPSQSLPQVYTTHAAESQAENIGLAWLFGVLRRRIAVMALAAIALSTASGGLLLVTSKQTPREYEGLFRLLVEPVTAEGQLARDFLLAQTVRESADIQRVRLAQDSLDYETQIRVLRSPTLINPLIEQMKARYPDINYASLMEKLEITRVSYDKDGKKEGTKILDVRYHDSNPQKVMFVLNQLSDAYLKYSLQERLTSLRQGIKFIEEQLPQLQKQVDSNQRKLQNLRQQYTVLDPQTDAKYLSEQLLMIRKERIVNQSQLAQNRALYADLQKRLNEDNPVAILAREAKVYETLLGQIQKVNTDLAVRAAQFREDSPPVKALRAKQQELMLQARREAREVILAKIASQIQELEGTEQKLGQTENTLNQRIKLYPAVARQYADLDRQLEVSTNALKQFLAKREALRIDAAQQEVPWQLIAPPELPRDRANQPIPAAQKTKRQLVIAVVLSMLLGIGIGFLIEVLNTVFHTPEELKAASRLRLLGVIPFTRGLKKLTKPPKRLAPLAGVAGLVQGASSHLISNDSSKAQPYIASPFSEAFRSLHTNIRLLSAETPIHSLVISSPTPGDGKSTVAFHLAQTAAAIGQRVLLVDADLRRPQLHTMMGLPNIRGLSDALTTDIGLNEAIQGSRSVEGDWSWEENLFVLTAGPTPPDPIKLLSSQKMWYLMEQFQAFFDLVIYDTPPLVGLADGNLLASHADGIVMVVGLDKTDRAMLMKALDGLAIAGASVLGVVANGVKGYKPKIYPAYYRR